jgi:drug/metabolite transporter (DMT)-like permease
MLLVSQVSLIEGGIAFLAFTTLFPSLATRGLRRALRIAVPWVALAGAILAIGSLVAGFVPAWFPLDGIFTTGYLASYLAIVGAAIASLVISFRESPPDERSRMRWLLAIFAFGFSGLVALFIAYFLKVDTNSAQLLALTIVAIPFGLAYVILRHRVLDIPSS